MRESQGNQEAFPRMAAQVAVPFRSRPTFESGRDQMVAGMADARESAGWRYGFGDVEVDPRAHTLFRGGHPVAVEPKVYALLLLLIERAGETVPHDDLLDRVWGHRHVSPGVLTRAIAQLRKALGDDPAKPRFIQTIHTLGYRFTADVERRPPSRQGASAPEPGMRTQARALRPRVWWAVALVLVVVVCAVFESSQPTADATAGPVSLVIHPFQVAEASGLHPQLGGLQSTLSSRLASLPGLRVAHGNATRVPAVELDGVVRRAGSSWSLDLQLRGSGRDSWRRSYPLDANRLDDTVGRIQLDVLRELVPASPLLPVAAEDARTKASGYVRAGERAKDGILQQDAQDAIASFRGALELDPGNAQAWCRLGGMYLQGYFNVLKSSEEVIPRATEAIGHGTKLDPGSIHCLIAQGELAMVEGRVPQARLAFQRAHALDPAMYEPRMWLTETDELRFNAARDMLAGLLRDFPDKGTLYFKLIQAYMLTGELDEARKVRELMLQRQPQVANVDWPSAWLESTYGEPAKAIRHYQALSAFDPGDRSYHVVAANTALSIGAIALARNELQAAGAMDTGNYIEANVMLFHALGDPQRALDWLQAAPRPPSLASFNQALQAQSLALAGRSDAARDLYSKAFADGVAGRERERIDQMWIDGQVLNWAALYASDDPRRKAIVAAEKRQLDRFEADGLGVPWMHYQAAQIAVLEDRTDDAMRDLDAAIDAGFTEALALRRDLPWRGLAEDARFIARKQRLDSIAREQRRQLVTVDEAADTAIAR